MAVKTNPTILVIEDYSDTRKLMSSLLRAHGYKVLEAANGKEGLMQANRVTPDLVLMDLAMPELDGIEATRQMRQRHASPAYRRDIQRATLKALPISTRKWRAPSRRSAPAKSRTRTYTSPALKTAWPAWPSSRPA